MSELEAVREFADTQHRALIKALDLMRKAGMKDAVKQVEEILENPLKRNIWPL